MSTTDSVTLWRNRIQNRKLSGLKVDDWCEKNSISRHVYYYWHQKLKKIQEEKENIFAEVLIKETPAVQMKKVTRTELLITWKDFSFTITDSQSIALAVELMSRLEKQC